ncbi:CapA family protein [Candidatus Parcubacteria bacterium]|nr:CapA family protein [Candidatus Parcubacteria bacterium]
MKDKNLLVILLLFFLIFGSSQVISNIKETESHFKEEEKKVFEPETILFVGDIMLDRGVEYLMTKNDFLYPFEKISPFLIEADFLVGNLEGPIVENPTSFPDGSLMFAFSPKVIQGLVSSNFGLFSLANNHTTNMGKAGLEETKDFLKKADINFVGEPLGCDKDFLFKKDNIIYLAFNKTFPFNCSDDEIAEVIKKTRDSNSENFVVVILHWGEEYQPKSSIHQQKLAHQSIDAGADLIIGSHPHVVQEIEEYNRKLIFYSLGNFIFDQYFSEETQQGLAVGLEIYPEKFVYKIFPIKSHLSQPFLMEQKDAAQFLEKLSLRSSPQLLNQIKNKTIEIKR